MTERELLAALEALGWREDIYEGGWFPPSRYEYTPQTPEQAALLQEWNREIIREFVLENKFAPYQKD